MQPTYIGVDDFRLCSSLDCPMHLKKSRSRGTFGWGAGRSRVALAANIGRQGWKMEGEEKRSGPVRTPHFFAVPAKRIQSRAGGIRRPIWLGRGRRSDVVITHRSTLLRAAWPQESNALAGRSYLQVRSSAVRTVGPIHQDTLASFKGLLECVEPLPLLPFSGGQSLPPVFQTPCLVQNADTHRCAPGRHTLYITELKDKEKRKRKNAVNCDARIVVMRVVISPSLVFQQRFRRDQIPGAHSPKPFAAKISHSSSAHSKKARRLIANSRLPVCHYHSLRHKCPSIQATSTGAEVTCLRMHMKHGSRRNMNPTP
jgi:hypothetical protein